MEYFGMEADKRTWGMEYFELRQQRKWGKIISDSGQIRS